MQRKISTYATSALLLLIYTYFCYLMLIITLQYIPFDMDVAFLKIKQDEMERSYYPFAFFIHAYTAILVLLAGFTQFSSSLRKQQPEIAPIWWIFVYHSDPFISRAIRINHRYSRQWRLEFAIRILSLSNLVGLFYLDSLTENTKG